MNGVGTFKTDELLRPISGNITFTILLTPQGVTAYGGYLQLAANGQGDADDLAMGRRSYVRWGRPSASRSPEAQSLETEENCPIIARG